MVVTVAQDHTARVWNYETQKCELVHSFRNDEPLAVAVHPTGFRILVSFKVAFLVAEISFGHIEIVGNLPPSGIIYFFPSLEHEQLSR